MDPSGKEFKKDNKNNVKPMSFKKYNNIDKPQKIKSVNFSFGQAASRTTITSQYDSDPDEYDDMSEMMGFD